MAIEFWHLISNVYDSRGTKISTKHSLPGGVHEEACQPGVGCTSGDRMLRVSSLGDNFTIQYNYV